MAESKPESMTACVAGIIDGLIAYGAFEKPYVLLGHSLGAWVAYEVLAELLRRGVQLVVGKRNARLSSIAGSR